MEKHHYLYRIYYGDTLVYVGRTNQHLSDRIRGHVFKKPMQRLLQIDQISKIEYAELPTEADMFLYEIYYINLLHPPLNRDDRAHDKLTVSLPDLDFTEYLPPRWDQWKQKIAQMDEDIVLQAKRRAEMFEEIQQKKIELRRQIKAGEISRDKFEEQLWLLSNEQAALYTKGVKCS